MINFYGGPKGENYVVSRTFGNTWELRKDLDLGGASPVELGEIVMISYGLPGTNEYDTNLEYDYGSDIIDNFYFTYNPYLQYYPSTEHHFNTNGHDNLYVILDSRYSVPERAFDGIKNIMKFNEKHCNLCQDSKGWSVWVKINLQGKIIFNGQFIKDASDINYNLETNTNPYNRVSGITWHLASSIDDAMNGVYSSGGGRATFKVSTDNKAFVQLDEYTNEQGIITEENDNYVIEAKENLYAILEVHPQTAIDFTTLKIDRTGTQFNYLNYNSCLYQKVLKNELNDTPESLIHIISYDSNFAYKFLTSSLGSTPIINFNEKIELIDSNKNPTISKNNNLSSLRHQVFDLKLPYSSIIKEGTDITSTGQELEYLQLKYKEEGKEIEHNIYIPTISATAKTENGGSFTITTTDTGGKTDEATLNLPTLSVAGENGAVIVTVKDNNNNSEQQTEITVVPEFDVNKEGNISWRLKGTDDEYIGLGNILGPQGEQGEQGEALQVTQQFSTTIGHDSNELIAIESIISGGFISAINEGLINLDIIEINEVIMGGINCKFYSYEYDESGEVVSTNFKNEESYIAFYTLATKDSQSSFTYQDKEIQFSYIPVSNIENSQVKYISSTNNQSLILNTSENYDPTDKIFGAEGLTAGETNKIGTKVFDIVGYEGTEGGEGYYVLNCDSEQQAADMLTDISDAIEESQHLKWSIKSDLCYDYAGDILNVELVENSTQIQLNVNNFYTNEVQVGEEVVYDPTKSYEDNGLRFGYKPLGYYAKQTIEQNKVNGILYICGYPKIGTRELFGRSYSFGSDNISQQAFSFQSGYGNQGYNKMGITIGQENISGYGNAVFGRWNDIGFAQMNISQGDYNKIGNYAKYDAQFGLKLKSDYDHQYQFGRYNKNKENNIIEVGYGSNEINRKNVFEVDKEGKIYSNEMENMVDQKITIFADTSKIQLVNIEPVWKKYPNYIMSEYLYDGGYDHYMTISSDCFEKNQRYLVEFCFQLKVEESGTLDFRELITGTGTRVEAFRNKYQTLNLEASDSLYTCIVTRFINPDEKDEEITNIESYGIGIHVSSTAKVIFHHTNTKIRQVYYIDNLFNNYTKNLFINLKNINTIITGEQDIFSFENDKEYISYNDILYLIPKEAIENYEIINTYIPSEFTQYNSQKWKTKLKLSYANFEESDRHYKVIDCLGLSADQDVMISFNPEYGIDLETYTQQKEIYDLIISNSYAETDNDKVIIYIVNPNIIDVENTTECPILIKVV